MREADWLAGWLAGWLWLKEEGKVEGRDNVGLLLLNDDNVWGLTTAKGLKDTSTKFR